MRNRTFLRALAVAAVMAVLPAILSAGASAAPAAPVSHGDFIVEYWDGTMYRPLASLSACEYQKEFRVDADSMTNPQLRVRKEAEGLAFLDSVALDGQSAEDNTKLRKTDFDMQEITSEGVVLYFTGSFDGNLSLTGRIEPEVIIGDPFMFPIDNTCIDDPQDFQAFFEYELGSNVRAVQADGVVEDLGEAFETRFLSPSTGHPAGLAYIYVSNDDEYLYACADFTSDNTYDYGADFFTVFAHVDGSVKEFKQTSDGHGYGAAAMQYTDTVPYEHMYYEMRIPLHELGSNGTLRLAFSLYGTAAIEIYSLPGTLTFTAGETANAELHVLNRFPGPGFVTGVNADSPGLTVQFLGLPIGPTDPDDRTVIPYTVSCATPGDYQIDIVSTQYDLGLQLTACTIPVHVEAVPPPYEPRITRLPETHTMDVGDSVTWEPRPDGGRWEYDGTFFSATFNSPATFSALKAGTSTITYRAAGMTESVTVTIHDAGLSSAAAPSASPSAVLPATGQDFSWVFLLCGIAAAVLAGAAILGKRRKCV